MAKPDLAPKDQGVLWAHPDGPADENGTCWREKLLNLGPGEARALSLAPAGELYAPSVYRRLVDKLGREQVFILSAGWGLVRADFPLPSYDITFSPQADAYKRRRMRESYRDFMQVPAGIIGPIVFLGGKDYLPLFRSLVERLPIQKIVASRADPTDPRARRHADGDWTHVPYRTDRKTNWHYGAAEALCSDPSGFIGA